MILFERKVRPGEISLTILNSNKMKGKQKQQSTTTSKSK